MAFNRNSYVKSTSMTAIQKIAGGVVNGIVAGLPAGTLSVASSSATNLTTSGAAASTVNQLSTLQTDNIVSGADSVFYALAGQNVNRMGETDISILRRGASDISTVINSINPETKISNSKNKDAYSITAVV